MDNAKKESLEMQLEWTKKQLGLLDAMDSILNEMRKIAESATEDRLSSNDREELNRQIKCLNEELILLEQQSHTVLIS